MRTNDNTLHELSDRFLSLVSGGTLNDGQKKVLDSMVSLYLQTFPGTTLEDFLSIFHKSYPEFDIESYEEDVIDEIRAYISHYRD
ncbi:MAG: hypothetical protein IJK53_02060 [Erysipelotrichaceae bacterium]|nr:hypothetical protein [Erysipelotrichaceae bacterium]